MSVDINVHSNQEIFDYICSAKATMDEVSPTFCLAKWCHVTILLYNGMTHSCHHPTRHKIPIDGLAGNPSRLHNTPIKIIARADMINGVQTPECDYCWRVENVGSSHLSDRAYKSASRWSFPRLDEVLASGVGERFVPSYLEVAFENTCNLACAYCTPEVSSKWMGDVNRNGPYTFKTVEHYDMHSVDYLKSQGTHPIHPDDPNPFIDAFWSWWPELYAKLDVFRITGGEPLLSSHTWKIFDHINANPNHHLEFAVNTNLCVPDSIIDRFILEGRNIQDRVKEFKVFTSLESVGNAAEYVRDGMDYERFVRNVDRILTELPGVRVVFMTTVNALSLPSHAAFLDLVVSFRGKHNVRAGESRVGLSTNILRWPPFMDCTVLGSDRKAECRRSIEESLRKWTRAEDSPDVSRLYLEEIDQTEALLSILDQEPPDVEQRVLQAVEYFEQFDARRGKRFSDAFGMGVREFLGR